MRFDQLASLEASLTHGLHDLLNEHRLKLLRNLAQCTTFLALGLALELPQPLKVEVRINAGRHLAHQITTSSARRLPELFKASRIEMSDEGVAPI